MNINFGLTNTQSKNSNQPQFKAKVLDKGKYAYEALSYCVQPKFSTPNVYRQYLPKNCHKLPILRKSTGANEDLKEVYDIYRKDFTNCYRYMSYKRFNNDLKYDGASVVVLKDAKETLGFYTVSLPERGNLYIDAIDMIPKYRNTKQGAKLINQCWDKINGFAKKHKCDKISLHVSSAEKPLIKLYERLGFKMVEKENGKYLDGSRTLYMEKRVGK